MSEHTTILGTQIEANSRSTPAGFTHVLKAPATLGGFEVPAKATVYCRRDGSLHEVVIPAAVLAGETKVKKTARIADDRGRWLLSGENGKKLVQDGLTIAAGDQVRVRADGTVLVAFPSKAGKVAGKPYTEGTRLNWSGGAWAVEADGEYVPDTREDDDEGDDDVIEDDGDCDED